MSSAQELLTLLTAAHSTMASITQHLSAAKRGSHALHMSWSKASQNKKMTIPINEHSVNSNDKDNTSCALHQWQAAMASKVCKAKSNMQPTSKPDGVNDLSSQQIPSSAHEATVVTVASGVRVVAVWSVDQVLGSKQPDSPYTPCSIEGVHRNGVQGVVNLQHDTTQSAQQNVKTASSDDSSLSLSHGEKTKPMCKHSSLLLHKRALKDVSCIQWGAQHTALPAGTSQYGIDKPLLRQPHFQLASWNF